MAFFELLNEHFLSVFLVSFYIFTIEYFRQYF